MVTLADSAQQQTERPIPIRAARRRYVFCQPLLDVLIGRGIEDIDSFIQPPSWNDRPDPLSIPGITDAVERVLTAIREQQRIAIFGDYDCVGILSTHILRSVLASLGVRARAYLPHRDEGYGLNSCAVHKFSLSGTDLLITVDNGINAHREILLAQRLGVDVIVIDHHRIQEQANTLAVWSQEFCGAGLAALFAMALALRAGWKDERVERLQAAVSQYAAIALVADCVPLQNGTSFDAYRPDSLRTASKEFTSSQLNWYLDLLNRFRGPDDRKCSLLDVFDPEMCTVNHPAWEAAPGTEIELPALTSDVPGIAGEDSEFAEIARGEIRDFRELAGTFAAEEIMGLAKIARAALADQGKSIGGIEDAIRYLALNSSARLEDLWADDDTLWLKGPSRRIHFDDMVDRRKADLLAAASARPLFEEKDFACYTNDEIRAFAFDLRKLILTERAMHLAICSRCRRRLEHWIGLAENFDRARPVKEGRADA
jgi:hypothetical protein